MPMIQIHMLPGRTDDEKVLNVYNWVDYIAPGLVRSGIFASSRRSSDGSTRFLRKRCCTLPFTNARVPIRFCRRATRSRHFRRRRAHRLRLASRASSRTPGADIFSRQGSTSSGCAKGKAFSSTAVVAQRFSLRSRVGARAGKPASTCKTIFLLFET